MFIYVYHMARACVYSFILMIHGYSPSPGREEPPQRGVTRIQCLETAQLTSSSHLIWISSI